MLPVEFNRHKQELYFNYDLPEGARTLSFRWNNPRDGIGIDLTDLVVYGRRP